MRGSLHPELLLSVFADPTIVPRLSVAEIGDLLRYARRANLLANLGARLKHAGVDTACFAGLDDRIEAATVVANEHARRLRWELDQLRPAFEPLGIPILVLKGGAYYLMRLASADGRVVSDLDLLVGQDQLARVEQAMLSAGYQSKKEDDYDQQYYRDWMHELPPMMNPVRGTWVDLHHNIAPPVSRLKIDAARLVEKAVPFEGEAPYYRLSDVDMVLHICVHMFHDGELDNALRELFDLDALLRRFSAQSYFWNELLERADELGLLRSLYYGLRFAARFAKTPVPADVMTSISRNAPARPLRWLLEAAMAKSILPETEERPTLLRTFAGLLLFLRSHWLRMPPLMLARHLWTQFRRRGGLRTAEQALRNVQ